MVQEKCVSCNVFQKGGLTKVLASTNPMFKFLKIIILVFWKISLKSTNKIMAKFTTNEIPLLVNDDISSEIFMGKETYHVL